MKREREGESERESERARARESERAMDGSTTKTVLCVKLNHVNITHPQFMTMSLCLFSSAHDDIVTPLDLLYHLLVVGLGDGVQRSSCARRDRQPAGSLLC